MPALFHEYLYDSANMGYDGVGSSAEAEDFRSRLEASLKLSEASSAWNGSCDNATDETSALGSSGDLSVEHQQVSSSISMKMPMADALDEGHGDRVQTNLPGAEPSDAADSTRWGRIAQAFALTKAPGHILGAENNLVHPRVAETFAEEPSTTNGSMMCRAQAHSRPNIFAPACQLHEMIDSILFTTSHVGNAQFVDVLKGWYSGHLSSVHVLDGHLGVRSGDDCGCDPASAQQLAALVTTGV